MIRQTSSTADLAASPWNVSHREGKSGTSAEDLACRDAQAPHPSTRCGPHRHPRVGVYISAPRRRQRRALSRRVLQRRVSDDQGGRGWRANDMHAACMPLSTRKIPRRSRSTARSCTTRARCPALAWSTSALRRIFTHVQCTQRSDWAKSSAGAAPAELRRQKSGCGATAELTTTIFRSPPASTTLSTRCVAGA